MMSPLSSARRRVALQSTALATLPLCALAPLAPAFAQTLPSGATVVAGTAAISTDGGRMDIRQTTGKAIIEWNDFSIGKGGAVTIDNGAGATLNRVTGANVSSIDGLLQATGSVYLINRNGIVVGKEGRIDVGGRFVGSTQDMSNASFLAGGDLTLAGASEAALVNYGKIGSLGGDVVLVAAKVDNQGSIEAANGAVGLLAGYQVLLRDQSLDEGKFAVVVGGDGTSVTNAGQLKAAEAELRAQNGNIYALAGSSSAIDARGVSSKDGRIFLTAAGSGEVNIAGTLIAKKADGSGGAIEVTGHNILLDQGAKLDASGTKGGTVLVGGDWQGGADASLKVVNHDVQNANAVIVAPDAKIDVSGSAGKGGKAVLWSDNFTNFLGHIDASGATDGGRVETSSKNILQAVGTVDAKAGTGTAGEWLLDPADITISTAADASVAYAGGTYTPTAGTSTINVASLNSQLNSGTNVTITTGGAAVTGGLGNITQASGATISKTTAGSATLTLKADRSISLTGGITTSNGGSLNVNLNSRASDGATGFVSISSAINTGGGNLEIWGGSGAAGSGATVGNHGIYIGANIDAGGGNIRMVGSTTSGNAYGISIDNKTVQTSGSGSITVTGTNTAASGTATHGSSAGVSIGASALTAGSGGITVSGQNKIGAGVLILNNAIINAGSVGDVTIVGTSEIQTGLEVYSASGTSSDTVITGKNVTLGGFSTDATNGKTGIWFNAGSVVKVNAANNATITASGGRTADTSFNSNERSAAMLIGSVDSGGSARPAGLQVTSGTGNTTVTLNASANANYQLYDWIGGLSNSFTSTSGAVSINGTGSGNGLQLKNADIRAGTDVTLTNTHRILLNDVGSGTIVAGRNVTINTPNYVYSTSITQTSSSGLVDIDVYGGSIGNLVVATNDDVRVTGHGVLPVTTANSITTSGSGDIYLTSDVNLVVPDIYKTAAAIGASKLYLQAGGTLTLATGRVISAASGAGAWDVTFNTNYGGTKADDDVTQIQILGNVTTRGGDVLGYAGTTVGGYANVNTSAAGVVIAGEINAGRDATSGGDIRFWGSNGGLTGAANTYGGGLGINVVDGAKIQTGGDGAVLLDGLSLVTATGAYNAGDRAGVSFGSFTSASAGSGGFSVTGRSKDGYGIHFRDGGSTVIYATPGTITLDGTSTNQVGIYRTASQAFSLNAADVIMKGTAETATKQGLYFANGSMSLQGSNSVTIIGTSSNSGTGVNISAPLTVNAGAGGFVLQSLGISSTSISNSSSTITSAGKVTIWSGLNTTIGGTVRQTGGSGSSISSYFGDIALQGAVTIDTNDLLVQARNGSITQAGIATAAGNLTIEAATNLSGGTLTSFGGLAVSAGTTGTGTISISGISQLGTSGAVTVTAPGHVSTGTVALKTSDATNITSGGTLTTSTISMNGNGDLTLDSVGTLNLAAVTKSNLATGVSSLTARSAAAINVNNAITASSTGSGAGALNVTLVARSADQTNGTITIANGITTRGGNIVLRGGSAALGTITDPTADLAGYTSALLATGAVIDISSTSAVLNAGGGDIEMRALGSSATDGLTLSNKTLSTTGNGSLRLYALGRTTDNVGVRMNASTSLSTVNGDLIVMGVSRLAGADTGVLMSGSAVSSTAGAITISGVGNGTAAATSSYGVYMASNASIWAQGTKALTVNGRGGSAASSGVGLAILSGAYVRATGAAAINLTGFGGGAAGSTALSHHGIVLDGTSSQVSPVKAEGSGAVTLSGRAGNTNSYGIYQGSSGYTSIGTSTLTGALTLIANSMFLNASAGSAKLLTSGILTLRAEDNGNLTLGSDIYAGFIKNNTLVGDYKGIVFGGTTGTSTGLTLYTQNGANIYAVPVTLAGSGTVSVTGDIDNKPLVANGGLILAGQGLFTQSTDITANMLSGSARTVSFLNTGNSIDQLGAMTVSNQLQVMTKGNLAITGAITTGTGLIRALGDLAIAGTGSVTATGNDTALQLTTNTIFTNNAGAGALSTPNGRWLVWLQDPSNDVGGLSYSFKQYGASYGITAPSQTTGNGVMYNQMPLLTISLNNNISKVYDGNTSILLDQSNYIVTGLLGNDTASVYSTATFDDKNVGSNKTITASDMAVIVRDGNVRIYGYGLTSYSVAGTIGAITARDVAVNLTGTISKVYDGSTAGTLSAGNVMTSGLVAGDNVQLVLPTTVTYDSKNAGYGKLVTATGFSLTGADAANYNITTTASANLGVITAKQLGASLTGSVTKVYDGNLLLSGLTASNVNVTGVIAGDTVSLGSGLIGLYADKNAGTGKSVTAYGLTLTGTDAANYTIASSVAGNIGTITRKTLSATLVGPVTKVYDGTTTATISGTNLNGVVAGDTVTVSATAANYDSKDVGTNRLITASGLALAGVDASNYTLSSTSTSGYVGTITARTVTVDVTGTATKVYDGTTTLTAAQIAGLGFTIAAGDSTTQALLAADNVWLKTNTITASLADKNAGTGKAMQVTGYSLSNNSLGNYVLAASTVTGLADVAKAALTLTAATDSKIYDGTTTSLGTVTATGLISGDSFTATQAFDSRNAGSRLLQVQNGYVISDGNGGGNYQVTLVDTAGSIAKRAVSTTVHVDDKIYDGTTTATGTFDPLTNIVAGDSVAASATLTFADKNVGTNKAVTVSANVLTGADAGNYVLDPIANSTASITKANLVLTAVSDTKAYDKTTSSAGTVQGVGLAAGDSFTATQAFDGYTAGSHNLQVQSGWVVDDGNGGGNYNVSLGAVAAGTIEKRLLTATATVDNKVYDGTTLATGTLSSLSNMIAGDVVTIDGSGGSLAFYDRNAGVNKTVVASGYVLTGADAANYALDSIANSSATISRAQLVLTAVSDTRQYDGTTASTGVVQASGLIAGDGFVATQQFDGVNAGAHTLQVNSYTVFDGNGGGNYNVSYGALADGLITQRVLQAAATINSKVYDGSTAATGTFSGLSNTIAGDDVVLDSSGATLAFYDRNAGVGKTVTVAGVSLSGADAANYTLSDIADGTATISKATLNLTAVTDSKVYDGTTASAGVVISSGLVAGDSVSATQVFDSKNAGGRTLQVNDWAVSDGNGGANYDVVLGTAASGSISQKVLTGSLTGTVSKVYDRTTTATLQPVNIAGVIAGDDLVVTTTSANFADANVGAGKTVTVSGMQLTGADSGNYLLSSTSASADIGTITPREVSVTVTGRGGKTYDGNVDLALSQFGTLALILADGDAATQSMLSADGLSLDNSTLSAEFADRNAGIGKAVTLSGFSLTNNSLGNYVLTSSSAIGLADIVRATLTLNAVSDSKIYDGTTLSTGIAQIVGLIAGDSATATQTFDSKNAGNRVLSVTDWTIDDGNGGANYDLVYNTAAGTITPKQINAALTGTVTKTYDGTTAAALLSTNLEGIVAGDVVTVTTAAANYADKNAGTGKLVTASGIQISGLDADNYQLLSNSASAYVGTITARQVVVSSSGLGSKTYDGSTALTHDQLGTISLLIADGDTATQNLLALDGVTVDASGLYGVLVDRNAGTGKSVSLSGYGLANNGMGNYVLASTNTQGVANVDRAVLTLTAVTDTKVYDGNTTSSGVVLSSGLVAGDTVSATQSFDTKNAGSRLLQVDGGYVIADGNNGANYSVSTVDAVGTIDKRVTSTVLSADNKVYDGSTAATGTFGALANLVAGDSVAASGTLNFADRNAGSGKTVIVTNASLTGADAGNYTLDPVANGTADITKASLVLTAGADNKVYDGTTASSGLVVANGLVGGDTVSAQQSFDSRNAGVRALQVDNGWTVSDGNGGNNYTVTIGSATAGLITPKVITATATVNNKTYDGTTAATGTFAGLNGVISGDLVILDGSSGSLAFYDRNAGTGKAVVASGYVLQGADAANYSLASIANGTADIYKAALVLNAVSADKVYDRTTSSAGIVQAVGLIAGDTVAATQSYDSVNAGSHVLSVDGNYTVFDGNNGGNYTVTIGDTAIGVITQKVLNAIATVNNKVYDGTTTATGSFSGLTGVIAGDTVVLDDTNGILAFLDRNAGNGKTVTVANLALAGADAGNYQLSDIANGTANIAKAQLVLTAVSDSKTYDGTTASSGVVLINGLVAGDTASAVQSFDSKNAGGRTLAVSDWAISDGNNGNNYEITLEGEFGTILQRHLSGTLTGEVAKVYGGTTQATLLPVNLDGVIAGDALTLTAADAQYDDRNAGTGKLVTVSGMTLSGLDAGNYVLDQDYATAAIGTITARAITVSASGKGSKTYDGTTMLSQSQLGMIVFTMADGDAATSALLALDGITLDTGSVLGVLADRNAGSGKLVTLSGYELSNNALGNYVLASDEAIGIADVARAALTLTAVSDGKTYDGTTSSSAAVLVSGLVAGDSINAAQAFDSRNAGNRTLQVLGDYVLDDGNGGANYIVAIGAAASGSIAQRVITTTAHANDKVYDGGTSATGYFDPLSDVVLGDDVAVTDAAWSFADRNAGVGKTVSVSGAGLSGDDAANYFLDTIADTTADISKAQLTLTAASEMKVYDGTYSSSGSVQVSGLAAGDQVRAQQRFDSKNAGSRVTLVDGYVIDDGVGGANYEVSLVDGTGTILRKVVTTTLSADGKIYDGTTAATGMFSELNSIIANDDVWLDGSSGTLAFSDRNAGANKTVTATGYSLGGADAANYDLEQIADATADITRATLLLAAVTDSKVYDRTTASTGVVTVNGLIAGDQVLATQAFDGWNAGARTLEVNRYLVQDGNNGGNYEVVLAGPVAGTITPRTITATATVNDKVYDGTTAATGTFGSLANVIDGDQVSASGGSFAFSDKNVGQGKVVLISGVTLSGTDAGNYVFNPVSLAVASITPKALIARFNGPVVKVYDGADLANIATGSIVFDGLVGSDTVGYSAIAHYSDKNAGTGKLVSVSNLSLTGADAMNYVVAPVLSDTVGSITQRQITVNLADVVKTGGTADPTFFYTVGGAGLVAGDTITGSPTRAAGEAPGTYTISGGSLTAGGNYAVTVNNGVLTIVAGSNSGLGPVTPEVVTDAGNIAAGNEGTVPPISTSPIGAPDTGGIGFDPNSGFGGGGVTDLPGNIAPSVQEDFVDWTALGENKAGGEQGQANGEGSDQDGSSNEADRCPDAGQEGGVCRREGDLRGMPYPTNRAVAPNFRFTGAAQ